MGELCLSLTYPAARGAALVARESAPPTHRPPRLLDRVRDAVRARHYSRRTEKAYVAWIRRYILFHGKRHPSEMGAPELTRYLSSLAVEGNVAASTQNQALSALKSDPISLDTVSTTMTGAKEGNDGNDQAEADSWQ